MRTETLTHSIDHFTRKAWPSNSKQRLNLSVIATTDAGTRAALAATRALSLGLDPHIVLFVPHVVPYAQPLDHPADSVAFTEDRFRRLAAEAGTDVLIRVCVCRSDDASLERLLARNATVLVGGRRRRWWLTREQRLARHLYERGHRVLFIDTNRLSPPDR